MATAERKYLTLPAQEIPVQLSAGITKTKIPKKNFKNFLILMVDGKTLYLCGFAVLLIWKCRPKIRIWYALYKHKNKDTKNLF